MNPQPLKTRVINVFLALAQQRGRAYAEGFILGMLARLITHDYHQLRQLERLEQDLGIAQKR